MTRPTTVVEVGKDGFTLYIRNPRQPIQSFRDLDEARTYAEGFDAGMKWADTHSKEKKNERG